tara:strand:- start:361244 stop:362125 length:882 start_codon:yes stop_codon:yes gene_type:complete
MYKALLIFTTYTFFSLCVSAAQLATVKVNRAVIYGDMAMKVPLGYVKKGKKLQVGEVKRKRGRILPVAINGRVGWIKTNDIVLDDEVREFEAGPKVFEHEILTADREAEEERYDPMSENNYIMLRMGNFSASEESLNVVNSTGSSSYTASMMSLYFEHRHPYKSYAWGAGLDYYKLESDLITYQVPTLKGQVNYIPFKFKFISLEAFGAFHISSDVKVKSAGLGTNSGVMYGLEYGALARLFPDSKIGASAGLSILEGNLRNIEAVENTNNFNSAVISKFSGTTLFINIHYKI